MESHEGMDDTSDGKVSAADQPQSPAGVGNHPVGWAGTVAAADYPALVTPSTRSDFSRKTIDLEFYKKFLNSSLLAANRKTLRHVCGRMWLRAA